MPPNEGDRSAFAALADETRLEILAVLGRIETPAPYSTLFDRVSIDDAGQFNYHLRQLRGRYVRKTDGGYRLGQPGLWASNLLSSGVLESDVSRPFEAIDSACGRCGQPVEIGYRNGEAIVRCLDCGVRLTRFDFPPRAAESLPLDSFVAAYARRTAAFVGLADDGVCPFCGRRMDAVLAPDRATRPGGVPVAFDCDGCRAGIRAPLGLVLAGRPRVAAAFADRGVDLTDTPFWEIEFCTFSAPRIRRAEPLEVVLSATIDGHDCRAVVDAAVELCEWSTPTI